MARAKSTARAVARRRNRAAQALPDSDTASAADPASPVAAGGRSRETPGASSTPGARLGIGTAFRQAFRPVDVRADLAALPAIALHSKALWLPLLLTIGTAVAVGITRGTDVITTFLYTYFVQTPAIGGVFIAGFLAPRASWLLGLIVGLVSAICYVVLGLSVAASLPGGAATPGIGDTIVAALLLSPVMGLFFASAAAWYRRFLQLSSPNRGRQAQTVRRGADGRTRGGSQTARR
ncbi:MAG: hypothetical protein H0U58_07495 [Chloroflexi bacterium]|nr:hypothetical protein [Chloroflexota bacterium]